LDIIARQTIENELPLVLMNSFSTRDDSLAELARYPELGHGDIYMALVTSGMLDELLTEGYRYTFISNADNLGAVLDKSLLGYFAKNKLPFMMEVADRLEVDKKRGHLARTIEGHSVLREIAQCPSGHIDMFQDISKYKYFNTNNIWLNLETLKEVMKKRNNILGLSLIRNLKLADPRKVTSTPVYQLKIVMGSVISVFKDVQAVRVPRSRFAPVKTTKIY